MANIGIFMLSEYGGLNATFVLARMLQRRGHRVLYLVSHEFEAHVARQGFEATGFDDELHLTRSWWLRVPVLNFLRTNVLYLRQLSAALEGWVARESIDVLLLDPVLWTSAAGVIGQGFPVALLNPTLSSPFSTLHPPIHSSVVPPPGTPGPATRLRNLLAWTFQTRVSWELGLYTRLLSWVGHDAPGLVRRARKRVRWGDFGYRPEVPELLISPRELDFAGAREHAGRVYVGTCVDLERRDPAADWRWPGYDPERPLAYCSLGTFVEQFEPARAFLATVIESFRRREGWQLLVSAGPLAEVLSKDLPPSIHVARGVAQLDVLSQTRLFLSHAGTGSLREALYFGVPLLVFPAAGNQFGLAARVVHHGFGHLGDLRTTAPERITEQVDALLGDTRVKETVTRVSQACRTQRELEEGALVVERLAGLSAGRSATA